MSSEAVYGSVESVSIVVQVPAPAGERWKATEATPDPPSLAPAASATVPRSGLPGSVTVPVGAVLLTVTVVVDESVVLPAASVARAISVYWPPAGCADQVTE